MSAFRRSGIVLCRALRTSMATASTPSGLSMAAPAVWGVRHLAAVSGSSSLGTVRDVLAVKGEKYFSISPDSTVFDAVTKMVKHNIGSLIVMDDAERPVSIITERDYLEKVTVRGKSSKTTLVKEVQSDKEFTYVAPHQSLLDTMEFMTSRKIRHVPVVENDKVLGMISIGDVVRELGEYHKKEQQDMREYISGGY